MKLPYDNYVYIKFSHKKYNNNDITPNFKKWNEMTGKMVRDDPDEKMGRDVLDELTWYEMVLARPVPEPTGQLCLFLNKLGLGSSRSVFSENMPVRCMANVLLLIRNAISHTSPALMQHLLESGCLSRYSILLVLKCAAKF